MQMGVFWSGTDMDTIKQLGANGWILATVFNQKEEKRSAFLTKAESPLMKAHEIFVDDIPTDVVSFYPQTYFDEWNKEFEEKVKEKKWLPGAAKNDEASEEKAEKLANEEFTFMNSRHFKNDERFEWQKGQTVDGKWVYGY